MRDLVCCACIIARCLEDCNECVLSPRRCCTFVQVSSIVLADSGTLLLCSIDRRADITKLRQSLRAAYPGVPSMADHLYVQRLLAHTSTMTNVELKQKSTSGLTPAIEGLHGKDRILVCMQVPPRSRQVSFTQRSCASSLQSSCLQRPLQLFKGSVPFGLRGFEGLVSPLKKHGKLHSAPSFLLLKLIFSGIMIP